MFTGLVDDLGVVERVERTEAGRTLRIASRYTGLAVGESIAVNGACLTVLEHGAGWFSVAAIVTTLGRTTIGDWTAGRPVNLERAMRLGDRLGGHLVQGHVDGVGSVDRVTEQDDARLLDLRVPTEVARVSVPLGSITVDGVSLTVNAIPAPDIIQISLIPFTLQHTTLGERRPGDRVHLEADALGKYVAALLRARGDLGAS